METSLSGIPFERLLKKALKNGGDFSEVYFEHKQGTSIVSEARRIERFVSTTESGLGLRVVVGDRSAYAYTNDFSALDELADTVAAAVKRGSFEQAISREETCPGGGASRIDPTGVDPDKKIEMVNRAQAKAWGYDPCVAQVKVMYGDGVRSVVVANSKGFIGRTGGTPSCSWSRE